MSSDFISLQHVTKYFGINESSDSKRKALDDITVTIGEGEFVGVAGSNGSGKSTFARMLNGLLLPTKGEVFIEGRSTAQSQNLKAIRQSVGMIFQNPDNQIIHPVIEDDIAFGPINLGLAAKEVKARTDWALEMTGLTALRRLSPDKLSGGQRQRAAIAAILAMKPKCLVLDEPTSMLDAASRKRLLLLLKELNRDLGMTVVFITHRMEDLENAGRLLVFKAGKIISDSPAHTFFLESEKMREAGLKPPELYDILSRIQIHGLSIAAGGQTFEQAEDYLCQLLKRPG